MPNLRSQGRSLRSTRLVLSLLVLTLLVLSAGCATQAPPLPSRPVPQLTKPELPESVTQLQTPPICSQGCSRGLTELLQKLEKLRLESAALLTKP